MSRFSEIASLSVNHPLIAFHSIKSSRGQREDVLRLASRITLAQWNHTTIRPSPLDLGYPNQGIDRQEIKSRRSFSELSSNFQAHLKVLMAQKMINNGVKIPAEGQVAVTLHTSRGPITVDGFISRAGKTALGSKKETPLFPFNAWFSYTPDRYSREIVLDLPS